MDQTTVGQLYDFCTSSYGESVALRQGNREVTYAELGSAARRLSGVLHDQGVRKGDRVAFLMANCAEYVFAEYALARIGGVRIPLAAALGSDDHTYMMNHSGATTLVYHEAVADRVLAMIPSLETVTRFICVSDSPDGVAEGHLHLQTLLEATDEADAFEADVEPSDLVGIYYTGGTTGRPKGVMLSHTAWVNSVLLEMLELGIERNEQFAYMTPLTHAAGVLLLPVLMRNGTAHIMDGFNPEGFFGDVQQHGITASMFVPTMIYALLDHPRRDEYDLSSLRNMLYGAAPMASERLDQAMEVFGPVFSQFYGQTEAPMMITALAKEEHVVADPDRRREIFTSCGRATMTTAVKLLDADGNEVPEGEVGEIVARCINVMDGYYRNPEATADTLRDGWLHTGDMARRDAEGFYFIVDRAKDMIISGGYNVYPREVEDALFAHPSVSQAAVIGVPDDKWGEAVQGFVVLHKGQDTDPGELIAFVKELKGSVMAPKSIDIVDEIPVTNLGKVDKKRMRAPYWEDHDRQV
jgi:fatty-acyl-CoA synthase